MENIVSVRIESGANTPRKDSPDDNRFDLRPFLYPPFTAAYKKIEAAVFAMGADGLRRPDVGG